MLRDATNFNIEAICAVIDRHGVEGVIIGGVAGILHGSELNTRDFDIVPLDTEENLARLAEALLDLNAEVLHAGKVRRFPDGTWLRSAKLWAFETRLGGFDVLFAPSGAPPIDELWSKSVPIQINKGIEVRVASLDDLIAMKKAAGRNKDLLAIPILEYLRDRKDHPVD